MNRLLATTLRDLRLLKRNGFLYAAGVMVAALVLVLQWIPDSALPWFLPLLLFGNFVTNGFYFSAGMMLLEKAERTLPVQFVTPLRVHEYVGAKMFSLSLLTLLESLIIVAVAGRGDALLIAVAVFTMTPLLCQMGLLMVTRYDSINRFLMPSVLVTFALALPLLALLEMWHSGWIYLHPLYPTTVLLFSAFADITGFEFLISLALAAMWIGLGLVVTSRVIQRFAATP